MKRAVTVLLPLALVLAGCPSSTVMHTAKPVRTGVNQIGINAVGFQPRSEGTSVTVPTFEIQVRRGLSESSDVGIKYSFPLTLTLDYNLLLANGSIPISIDPTISPMYLSATTDTVDANGNPTTTTTNMFWAWGYLPVLVDVISTQSLALTLSPRVGFVYASAASSSDGMGFADSGINWMYGGGVGLRIGGSDSFAVMPEASFLAPFNGGGVIFQGAIGFLF